MAQYDAMAELMSTLVDEEPSPRIVDEMTKPRRVVAPAPPPAPTTAGASPAGAQPMSGGGLPNPMPTPPTGSPPPPSMPTQGMPQPPQGMQPPPQGMQQPPQGVGGQTPVSQMIPKHLQGAPQVSMGGKFQSLRAQQLQQQAMTGGSGRSTTPVFRRRMAQKAREEEMKYRQMSAQQQRQADIQAAQTAAGETYNNALQITGNDAVARRMAKNVLENPDQYGMINESLLGTEEAMRTEKVDASILSDVQRDRFNALKRHMPESYALAYSQNEDMSLPEGVKLYEDKIAADLEAKSEGFRIKRQAADAEFEVDNTLRQLSKTLGFSEDFGSTGILGAVFKKLPQTSAYSLDKSIDVQKAKMAFEELLNMRRQSETGGALGNVSNREIELLYSAFTALDQGLGKGDFQSNLADVMQRFERVKFFLNNEEKFQEMGMSAKDMNKAANRYVSVQVAGEMDTPPEAVADLFENPESVGEFEKTFGWRPIQLDLDDGHYGK